MSDVVSRAGTATVLFTDLVASTQLRQTIGDERADDLRRMHDRILRDAIAGHGGTEVKGTGDGLMATFGAAAEAVSAAVAMQRGMLRLARRSPVPVAIRVGISAGDVSWEGGDCFGTPVVEASRLCNAADSGVILVSEVVRLLAGSRGGHVFRPVGALELKGLDAALPAAEVDWGAPVEAHLPLPAPLGGAHIVSFVGRAAERERLHTAWKEAAEGVVKLLLISGEPGVGKTRLVSELARQVHDDGAVVLFGRCDEDLAVPYQPFVEALRDYIATADVDDLAEQAATFGGDVARIVPLLAERVPHLPEALRADPDTERYRLFEAVAAFLRAIASEAPVLLVLDDVHWAGKPELLLLRHVLRGAAAPILMVGTYRDTDLDRRHPLAEVLSELRRDDALDRINLTGLDEGEVTEFLEAAAGGALGHDGALLSREVHEETEGNPFFVGQVLRHLVESGAVIEVDGHWVRARGAAGAGIPEGIREVIGRRLAMLSDSANELLAAASVLGREFVIDVVREATDAEPDAVLDAMEEAEAAHVIESVPDAPRSRSFVHALFRSTLYEEIPTTRRLRLHRRMAQALEARAPDEEARPLAELARHYCEAAALGETENAVRYSVAAAEQARDRLAYEEAAALYERGLAVLDPSLPADQVTLSRLLVALGRVRWAFGDREAACAALLEAGAIARARGEAELFAEAAIARGGKRGWSEAGVVDETLVHLLEESLALLPQGDHRLRALAMARLASELYFLTAESERRIQLTQDAVAMARRCCEGSDLAVVLSSAHWGAWVPGNPAERLAMAEEILALGVASRDREVEVNALLWMTPDLVELRRGEEVALIVDRGLALADELRQPEYQWGTRVQKTCVLLMSGNYDEAERVAQEALGFGSMMSDTATQMFGVAHLHLTRARGGFEAMEPLVAAMVERYPLLPAWRTGLALVYAELDRDEELREQVELLAADDFGILPRDANWVIAHAILAWGCSYLGDAPRCAALYERLSPLAPYAVTVGLPADCLGSVEGFLAPLCVVLGDMDKAEAHIRAGLAATEAMGNPAGAATLAYAYAKTMHRHAGPEHRKLTEDAVADALERAEAVGMLRVAARTRELIDAQ